jgi:hypothetical protein
VQTTLTKNRNKQKTRLMKYCHIPLHMLLLAGLVPVAVADDRQAAAKAVGLQAPNAAVAPANSAASAKPVSRLRVRPAAAAVAFLGVEIAPVSLATAAELGLTLGSGLDVRFVAPQSPAHNRLRVGDVLVWLDDQLLCNGEQFRVLVRSHKPGNTVSFKIYRAGNALEVPVQLGQLTLSEPRTAFPSGITATANSATRRSRTTLTGTRFFGIATTTNSTSANASNSAPAAAADTNSANPASANSAANSAASAPSADEAACSECCTFLLRDRESTAVLSINNGKKRLLVKKSSGALVFDGEVDTPSQRAALSESLKKTLQTIEQLSEVRVQTN